MPQPLRIGTPMAQKNSSISRAKAAPPLMKKRRWPPVSVREGCEHQAVRQACAAIGAAARIGLVSESGSHSDCPLEDQAAYGGDSRTLAMTAACIFS